MNQQALYQGLVSLGIPVAYSEFEDTKKSPVPSPPFITYQFVDNSDFFADNLNHFDISNYQIELYTARKTPSQEVILQNKLKELGLSYTKTETRIPEEKLYQVIYLVQLIGG